MEGSDGQRDSAAPLDETRKGFWDDFSSLAEQRKQSGGGNSIGTSAMGVGKKGGAPPLKKDEWDDW